MVVYSIRRFAKETGMSLSILRRRDKEDPLKPVFVSDGEILYYSYFSAGLYGKRAYKVKKMIEELTRDDPNQKS